jgi:hypothetical protein
MRAVGLGVLQLGCGARTAWAELRVLVELAGVRGFCLHSILGNGALWLVFE